MQKIVTLPNLDATNQLGVELAQIFAKFHQNNRQNLTIYLQGNLGAGKTTLTRAIIKELGFWGAVKSPTYSIVEEYNLNNFWVYHFDLYRINDPLELELIGIREYFHNNAICLIEWADKGLGAINDADLTINLQLNDELRTVEIILSNVKLKTDFRNFFEK